MNYFPIMGQSTAFIASRLKEIGFTNIEGFIRLPNQILVVTKPDSAGRRSSFSITITFTGEYKDSLDKLTKK